MAMARILPFLASEFIILTLLSSLVVLHVAGDNPEYVRSLDRKLFGLKQEKLSHFHMYWHDTYSGPNPSAMALIQPTNTTPSGFGFVSMIDDPLTVGPELSSKLIGKAQGLYASASQQDAGLLMIMNFVFLEGKYNGSTITIVGRNKVFSKVREMPVVGGSGLFRFARGYAQASTHSFNQTTGDAVVEYNLYVLHY